MPQVPAVSDETSVQIVRPSIEPSDPLAVEQPSADAIDVCDSTLATLSGTDCDTVALPVEAGTGKPAYPVEITSEGAFLQLEPQADTVYEPDEIVRRLDQAATTPAPEDWGVNAVATGIEETSIPLDEPPPLPLFEPDAGPYDFSLE